MKWQLSSYAIRNCGGSTFAAVRGIMKVLIATDAWRPQVNGVVRTLGALARAAARIGVEIEFLSPWPRRVYLHKGSAAPAEAGSASRSALRL